MYFAFFVCYLALSPHDLERFVFILEFKCIMSILGVFRLDGPVEGVGSSSGYQVGKRLLSQYLKQPSLEESLRALRETDKTQQ